jgi:quercetin dioxygenase-like cupin family protein
MTMIKATDAPTYDAGGAVITGLAAPSRGARDVAAWRVRFHAGRPSPAHSLSQEEVFIVLDGAVTARYADREETVSAGGALIVPAGEQFSLVAADAPAEAVCVMAVGGRAIVGGEAFTPPWAE